MIHEIEPRVFSNQFQYKKATMIQTYAG